MPESNPLLSVIIPTRGRDAIACEAIRLVSTTLQSEGRNAEVVVQDCTPSPSLPERLGKLSNVRYEHTGKAVSMTENWERAISRARGDFITVIGDDDGVMPCIIDAARWMGRTSTDALIQRFGQFVRYFWPDYPEPNRRGLAIVYTASGNIEFLSPERELRLAAVTLANAPRRLASLYYGLVRRDIVEEMKRRTGVYVDGSNPDYYSSFALTPFVRKLALVDCTVFLPGACGLRWAPNNSSRTREHLAQYSALEWPSFLPHSRASGPMLAESIAKGLERSGRGDLIRNMDFAEVYWNAMLESPRETARFFAQYLKVSRTFGRRTGAATANLSRVAAKDLGGGLKRRMAAFIPRRVLDRSIVREVRGVPRLSLVVTLHEEYARQVGLANPFGEIS